MCQAEVTKLRSFGTMGLSKPKGTRGNEKNRDWPKVR